MRKMRRGMEINRNNKIEIKQTYRENWRQRERKTERLKDAGRTTEGQRNTNTEIEIDRKTGR